MKYFAPIGIIFLVLCPTVYAMPVNYSANGIMSNISQTPYHQPDEIVFLISGTVLFDDTLRLWNGGQGGGDVAPPLDPMDEGLQLGYDILGYSLVITDIWTSENYSFSGTGGYLYMERGPGDGYGGMWDIQWGLSNGSGDFHSWDGEHFYFYHEDSSPYDLYNEMDVLAPIIQLTEFDDYFNNPIFQNEDLRMNIVLTNPEPIPEPSTMILVGIALAGLAGAKNRQAV